MERPKALNYLILNSGYPYIRYIPFNSNLSIGFPYHFLLTFLGFSGLKFYYWHCRHRWSIIVNDLIKCTGQATFGRRGSRGSFLGDFINIFNDFEKLDNYVIKVDEEDGIGIPILFIIIQDKEKAY